MVGRRGYERIFSDGSIIRRVVIGGSSQATQCLPVLPLTDFGTYPVTLPETECDPYTPLSGHQREIIGIHLRRIDFHDRALHAIPGVQRPLQSAHLLTDTPNVRGGDEEFPRYLHQQRIGLPGLEHRGVVQRGD